MSWQVFDQTGALLTTGVGIVTAVLGTANRITSTPGTMPVIDISANYAGQSSITILGTIATGEWNGTTIANLYIDPILTGKTYNGLLLTSEAIGFTIAGGATSKTLTVPLDATVSGINTGDQSYTASGDATAPSSASNLVLTLATVNGNVGSFTNASITVNAKGLITAASSGTAPVTSVAGTLNRISVTGGTTAVVDIDAAYVGQTSITTLGTIATGTWSAGVIAGQYGGTGIANTGFTITLAGSLVTTGAFTSTFAASATATYTLPTATSTLLANNLGLSGGTTLVGGTAASETLTLSSTSNATKGKLLFGNSAYDEVNNILLIGATTAVTTTNSIEVIKDQNAASVILLKNVNAGASSTARLTCSNLNTNVLFGVWGSAGATVSSLVPGDGYFIGDKSVFILCGSVTANSRIKFCTNSYGENFGIYNAGFTNTGTTPTAYIHLKAGTATASTAPIKLTSQAIGAVLTAPEAGAVEFSVDNYFLTSTTSTIRKTVRDLAYRAVTALRTLDGSDEFVDCTSGSYAITLPTAVAYTKIFTVINSGVGSITIATTSSQTVNGAAPAGLAALAQYESYTFRSNGASWYLV